MEQFHTKYSLLNELVYGDDAAGKHSIKAFLKKYRLFAFLIYDPECQPSFHTQFSRLFPEIHQITGESFTFFSLFDPRKEHRQGQNRFDLTTSDVSLSPSNSYSIEPDSIAAYSYCKSFDIDYDELPVLILTDNLEAVEYHILTTSEDYFEDQIQEIGVFCSHEMNPISISGHRFQEMVKRVDFCSNGRTTRQTESIAQILLHCLTFQLLKKDSPAERTQIKKRAESILSKYHTNRHVGINDGEKALYASFLAKVDGLTLTRSLSWNPHLEGNSEINEPPKIWYLKKRFWPEKRPRIMPEIGEDYRRHLAPLNIDAGSENESRVLVKTFNTIQRTIYTEAESHTLDFSPLGICLGKAFEIEINASVVQWIREYLGIDMPEYYKKRKPTLTSYTSIPSSVFGQSNMPIDFNQGTDRKWYPPALGASEAVLKTLDLAGHRPVEISRHDYLLTNFSRIRKLRNRAAHTEPMLSRDLEDLYLTFSNLITSGVYAELITLKQRLRIS